MSGDDEIVDTGFEGLAYKPTEESPSAFTAAVNPETMPPADTASPAPGSLPSAPEDAPTAAVGLTQEGRDALKAIVLQQHPLPKDFGPAQLVALARDLALDIHTSHEILKRHGLDQAQFEFLREHNEFFKNILAQQAQEWQSIKSTPARLQAQAAAALEEQLPVLASRMGARSEKLADAVEAAKLFAKVAGADGPASSKPSGEGFTITIDLGADTRITVGPVQDQGASPLKTVGGTVRPVPQGQTAQGQVRQDVGGQGHAAPLRQLPSG